MTELSWSQSKFAALTGVDERERRDMIHMMHVRDNVTRRVIQIGARVKQV